MLEDDHFASRAHGHDRLSFRNGLQRRYSQAGGPGRSTSSIDGKGGRCDGGMAATIGFASECERVIAFDDHHTRLADPGSSEPEILGIELCPPLWRNQTELEAT
jgi:hypothetical protein